MSGAAKASKSAGAAAAPPKASALQRWRVPLAVLLLALVGGLLWPRLATLRASPVPHDTSVMLQAAPVPEGGVVRGNFLPDGRYPNVTGRHQVLDYGVDKLRPIDGIVPFEIRSRVPVEEWDPQRSVAATCIARGDPVVLRNSVVKRWKAMGKWTPETFRAGLAWPSAPRAKRLRRAFINFEFGTPLDSVTPWSFWENVDSRTEHPMSIEEWFTRAQNHSDSEYYFLAEEIPKHLLDDVSPRHTLKLKDQTWVYFSVWMGEGGATTAAHWDMDDNFYVQYYGRKRFLLFHPDTYKSWKSYPRASPNHKQVVMRRGDPSRYSYILHEGAPLPVAYEAVLSPGDMLFIPAYWYHHVEAMLSAPGTSRIGDTPTTEPEHLSISSNFWSTSDMRLLQGLAEPLPFHKSASDTTGGRSQLDVDAIVAAFPADYPRALIPLAARLLLGSMVSDAIAGAGRTAAVMHFCIKLRYETVLGPADTTAAARVCPPPLTGPDQSRIAALLARSAQPMIAGLRSLRTDGARETELLNYLEMVVSGTFPARSYYDVLRNCYAHTLRLDPRDGSFAATGLKSRYAWDDDFARKIK